MVEKSHSNIDLHGHVLYLYLVGGWEDGKNVCVFWVSYELLQTLHF